MNRVVGRICAASAVARTSRLRRRSAAAPSLPLPLPMPLHTAYASATVTRLFTTSFLGKLGDAVAFNVSQLAENVWIADEKLVTEPRRKLERQRVANTTLAERLAAQRNVRQRLVPTSVTVDKSREYVEFTWPEEAIEVMRSVSLEAGAPDANEPPNTLLSDSSDADRATTTGSSSVGLAVSSRATENDAGTIKSATCGELMSARSPVPHSLCSPSGMPLRTRALAEHLRAYTPSTDGAFTGKDIIIYGRRGIKITKVIPIGNYALRFVFSDDHSGGIYSYEYLYYLTGPTTKYRLMRSYITELRQRRKPRDPPKRAPSTKYPKAIRRNVAAAPQQ